MKHFFAIVLLLTTIVLHAGNYTPQTTPDPKIFCGNCFVSNPDGILSSNAELQLNEQLQRLEQKSEVQAAIVVIDSINNLDYTEFAYELFNYWHIGNANNSGLLILFVGSERAVKIETGYGLEGLMPDAVCERVLNNTMFPLFKQGNYDEGFIAGVQEITNILTSQVALEELLLGQSESKLSAKSVATQCITIYGSLAMLLLILITWISYYELNRNPEAANNIRYRRISQLYHWTLLLTFLFPLPMLFFVLWLKKKRKDVRTKPVCCPKCNKQMQLLTEQKEDAYLGSKEQKEEDVKSIDYDVWLCPDCENTVILPYVSAISKYTKCPQCGAKTYCLFSDVIVQNATSFAAGSGQRTYKCAHCRHIDIKTYVIPRIVVASSGGKSSGGKSSGGFGGGGSWGGGFSGGGGAGGRF